ncbi:hypothetical protein A2W54_03320 [Candidatus Giovannonibacteria bacterium RIFCSPHIGHO2_02_43_13]|uniref:DUF2283 domain-containing protein n=1 Tax=Candidatus Giovannonibacteria bacterium RIFCSPHIGHO2_02_43_13 TaxID=1798330 RepID=A0A1F5WQ66_9BACT|nr:MAG: hypothetical protein UW28_C0004G0008 [Parcubacteria group bacterium GW2011_GWA2_44_13]OGF73917.1 MAG: hypothetical protein A3E06_00530 [Candidatus Giovannonibacteria bacterium RIFCSPHIGHO2_12_FULL_44_42]OGF77808.1 MAG: hypothetical protein A2W54_03320 [Candidatus Giovannonibacteria bacterium RIFCSPHIGHO2_02_43_13]OGF88857.1 MAG: hypothetical protein A3I94_02535 [Candidatus Giovannonibacteria bacterium RIFCSPLOWO2_02_FULL_43_54]OGF96821.1 MAG: hypothetical protein A3H08_01425 [Candidatus
MKIQYDKQADALYIYIGKGKIKKTIKAGKNALIDMGDKDRVIGVEFYKISLSASKERLQSVSVELPVNA